MEERGLTSGTLLERAEDEGIGMGLQTPEKIRGLQRKLYVKAKEEPNFRFYLLYDKVYRKDILEYAYLLSREKRGASGVDGVTFETIEDGGREKWLEGLKEELRNKTYKPAPVRRVSIPKPGGGERPLGIPTIRDRVVQTAAKLVLEPIFEADFEDCAYGYRPKRSAQDAVREVHDKLCKGYTDVVDADLTKYFGTIPHDGLMKSVARRISDRHMLHLIKMWLKVPIEVRDHNGRPRMGGGKKSKRGTPQGGVISPLLANIYIHRYLKAWPVYATGERLQAYIVNYADDFVILSRGYAVEALGWTRRVLQAIGLELNEAKTRICDANKETFDFLGYTFGWEIHRRDGHRYLAAQPSKKSVARLRQHLRQHLRRKICAPWPEVQAALNRSLTGWAAYFSYGTRYMAYRAVDQFTLNAVRNFLQRRHKVPSRGTRRFTANRIFGELGVRRLRTLHVGSLTRACT